MKTAAALSALAAALLICGCASVSPGARQRPQAAPVRAPGAARVLASPDTLASVAQARSRVQAARTTLGRFSDADATLAQAEAAASQGDNPRAQSLARQVQARADFALQTHYTRKAAAELQALYATTGLNDEQYSQLRAAEAALIRGESGLALTRLQGLRKVVATATKTYTVKPGDTLTGIAASPEFYGNSLLWPLIWEANKNSLPDPHKLKLGQVLSIRPSPTVDEVVQAIAYARQNTTRVKVGPVVPVQ